MKNTTKGIATIAVCFILAPVITIVWAVKFMKMKDELRLPQRDMYE